MILYINAKSNPPLTVTIIVIIIIIIVIEFECNYLFMYLFVFSSSKVNTGLSWDTRSNQSFCLFPLFFFTLFVFHHKPCLLPDQWLRPACRRSLRLWTELFQQRCDTNTNEPEGGRDDERKETREQREKENSKRRRHNNRREQTNSDREELMRLESDVKLAQPV